SEARAFIDYVTPGGILFGVAGSGNSAGTSAANFRTDMKTLLTALISVVKDPREIVFLISAQNAAQLGLLGNEFPRLGVDGGTVAGFTFLSSQAVGNRLIALHAPSLLLADGGIELDSSREAMIEMDTAPAAGDQSPISDISTMKSFFQND